MLSMTALDCHAPTDNGALYSQVKAPSRVGNMSTGDRRYRWTETGTIGHRYAHAFDHLYVRIVELAG